MRRKKARGSESKEKEREWENAKKRELKTWKRAQHLKSPWKERAGQRRKTKNPEPDRKGGKRAAECANLDTTDPGKKTPNLGPK